MKLPEEFRLTKEDEKYCLAIKDRCPFIPKETNTGEPIGFFALPSMKTNKGRYFIVFALSHVGTMWVMVPPEMRAPTLKELVYVLGYFLEEDEATYMPIPTAEELEQYPGTILLSRVNVVKRTKQPVEHDGDDSSTDIGQGGTDNGVGDGRDVTIEEEIGDQQSSEATVEVPIREIEPIPENPGMDSNDSPQTDN